MNKNDVMLALSALGAVLGLSAFITFFFFYENYRAGIFALISVVFAVAYFHLTWLDVRGDILQWHNEDTLNPIMHFSFFGAVISSAAMVWYLFEVIYFKEGTYPISESSTIAAVWAFMCAKWSSALFFRVKFFKTKFNLR